MGEDPDRRGSLQRGEPDRRPHVVGEDEERRAVGMSAAVERHAVGDRAHAVLADAEVQVAAGVVARPRRCGALDAVVVRLGEVGAAADERRARARRGLLQHLAGARAGGVGARRPPSSSLAARSAGTVALHERVQQRGLLRFARAPGRRRAASSLVPGHSARAAATQRARTSSGTRNMGSSGQPRRSLAPSVPRRRAARRGRSSCPACAGRRSRWVRTRMTARAPPSAPRPMRREGRRGRGRRPQHLPAVGLEAAGHVFAGNARRCRPRW